MGDIILVSACLLGLACRYDGQRKSFPGLLTRLANLHIVPACPEQLGGLATPRPRAELCGGDGLAVLEGKAIVRNAHGRDITAAFLRGASETTLLAHKLGARRCLLKGRSPSCGLTPEVGVTAARLLVAGLDVEEIL